VPAFVGHRERLGQQVGGDLGVEDAPVEIGQQQLRVGTGRSPLGTVGMVSLCTPHRPRPFDRPL
jgi:hypothetical protein